MGLLTKVLTFPVSGPVKGLFWVAEKIAERAEDELYDPKKIQGKLMELELMLDLGEITEEAYMEAEEELLELLRVIQEREQAAQG